MLPVFMKHFLTCNLKNPCFKHFLSGIEIHFRDGIDLGFETRGNAALFFNVDMQLSFLDWGRGTCCRFSDVFFDMRFEESGGNSSF